MLLQLIDQHWREHLYNMDYLREGIHLRALGQKDPLSEYRLEGHTMFDEMMGLVKGEFVRYMFHIQVDQAPEAEEQKVADVDYSYQSDPIQGFDGAGRGGRPRASTRPRRSRAAPRGRRRAARAHRRRQGGSQRPLPLRLGQEVQEVPRGIGLARGLLAPDPMSTDSTLSLDDLVQRATRLRERAGVLGEYLDPAALERRVAELEREMGDPGFWDDQANARAGVGGARRGQRAAHRYRSLVEEIDSLDRDGRPPARGGAGEGSPTWTCSRARRRPRARRRRCSAAWRRRACSRASTTPATRW